MKQEFLEYLIRECVNEVLEAFPGVQEPDTIGAPAPPAGGQGTADQPTVTPPAPDVALPTSVDARGVQYVNPNNPNSQPKNLQQNLQPVVGDPSKLERTLYQMVARDAGPQVKVASATLREVPKVIANPNLALFLYVGKQNDDDEDIYLLPAKTSQEARANSVPSGTQAQHPTIQNFQARPQNPDPDSEDSQNTMAPDIDEAAKLRNMLSGMIREALVELQ